MSDKNIPKVFRLLLCDMSVENADIVGTPDGFYMVNKSLANILATKGVLDFLDSKGERLACSKFFDDWFLYAVLNDNDDTYSLLKLREQEHDAEDGSPADGDTPGVTISFIAFALAYMIFLLVQAIILRFDSSILIPTTTTPLIYPYFFVNLDTQGVGGVLMWTGILSVAFVAVGFLFFGLDRIGKKRVKNK
jgi:hypothetical protein